MKTTINVLQFTKLLMCTAVWMVFLNPQTPHAFEHVASAVSTTIPPIIHSSGFPAVAKDLPLKLNDNGVIVSEVLKIDINPPIAVYTNLVNARINVKAAGKFVHSDVSVSVPQGFTKEIHYSKVFLFGKVFLADGTAHSSYLGATSLNSVDTVPAIIVDKTTEMPLAGAYQSLIEVEVTS